MTEAGLSLRPARTVRAIQDIADQIRDELRAGRLKPGQRLPAERELAKILGVGRNTVREAMSMLEVSGLIERRPGTSGGAFIRQSTGTAVADRIADGMMLGRFTTENIIEARLALETFIARQACVRGTDEEFDALSANIEKTAAIPASSWEARLDSYAEFLQIFVGTARNPLLNELAQPLVQSTAEIVRRIGPPKKDKVLEIRRKLVAALRNRDPDEASELVAQAMAYIRKSWASRS